MTKAGALHYAREIAWLRIAEAHFRRLGLGYATGWAFEQRKAAQARWAKGALRF